MAAADLVEELFLEDLRKNQEELGAVQVLPMSSRIERPPSYVVVRVVGEEPRGAVLFMVAVDVLSVASLDVDGEAERAAVRNSWVVRHYGDGQALRDHETERMRVHSVRQIPAPAAKMVRDRALAYITRWMVAVQLRG